MRYPLRATALLALAFAVGSLPQPAPHGHVAYLSDVLVPTAHAQTRIRNLLERLQRQKLPKHIVKTNGRIEATQVDVSAKYAGRLADVTVEEGSEVTEGQVVGRVASPEYEAQLRETQFNVQRAKQATVEAEALIDQEKAILASAKSDFERGEQLVAKQIITQQTFDQRRRNYESAQAGLHKATAQRDQAEAAVEGSQAQVERIEAVLRDLVLVSPRSGRVQYQLARSGEFVPTGGKVLTILDLNDVYMTIFVPAATAGKLGIGSEARIILDPVPQYVIPASVSFVAADAQFTPKTVETQDEREKLMFRVKLKVDPEVLKEYAPRVKTGVRGLGIVRTDPMAPWPSALKVNLPHA
jgi:HlyD family secretion protein